MSLSPTQYGTLVYFMNHTVTVEHVKRISNVTVRSLLRRGYLFRNGNTVPVSDAGVDAVMEYRRARLPLRSGNVLRPLSPQVEELLYKARLTIIKSMRRAS